MNTVTVLTSSIIDQISEIDLKKTCKCTIVQQKRNIVYSICDYCKTSINILSDIKNSKD